MPDQREPRTGSVPNNSRSLPAVPLDRRLRKAPAVAASPFRLPCGAWFSKHRKQRLQLFQECSATLRGRCLRVLELALRFLPMLGNLTSIFPTLGNGPPLRGPPINWGPVRYAPCFFLIFAGKLKHRETVTRCDLPLRPLMQTLCVWGPTSFFPAFSRGNETA